MLFENFLRELSFEDERAQNTADRADGGDQQQLRGRPVALEERKENKDDQRRRDPRNDDVEPDLLLKRSTAIRKPPRHVDRVIHRRVVDNPLNRLTHRTLPTLGTLRTPDSQTPDSLDSSDS